LFIGGTRKKNPIRIMDSWTTNLCMALDITGLQGDAPHALPDKYHKWLRKCSSNNAISTKNHESNFEDTMYEHDFDHKDVVMKCFLLYSEDHARVWFRGFYDVGVAEE
jgi:hypothetical protein